MPADRESVGSSGAVHGGRRRLDLSVPESKAKPKPQPEKESEVKAVPVQVPVTSHLSSLLSSDSTPSIAKRTVGFRSTLILNLVSFSSNPFYALFGC